MRIIKGSNSSFNGGCFLNDPKSKRQVIFSYLHYGGLGKIKLSYVKRVVAKWSRSAQLAWLFGGGKNNG